MNHVIWKKTLTTSDRQRVEMPQGAEILTVQQQGAALCVWFLCDPSRDMEVRVIDIYGTGHSMPSYPGVYLGTYQLHEGALVFHVFEAKP